MDIRRFIPLLLYVMISLNCCCFLPIPTGEQKVLEGAPVTQEQLAFLMPNNTTKEEVIGHLGSPSLIWEEANVFAYDWTVRQGIVFWIIRPFSGRALGGFGEETDVPKRYILLIQFDGQDRLQRFEKAVPPKYKSFGDFLKEWVANSGRR